jgi:hypothetical protein
MSDTRFPSGGRGSIFSLTSPFIEPRLWLSREMPRAGRSRPSVPETEFEAGSTFDPRRISNGSDSDTDRNQ